MADRHRSLPPWIRLDAGYAHDERVMRVGVAGEVLWLRTIAASRRHGTDGHLTREQQRLITHGMDRRTAAKGWEALIREGLLEVCDDGIRVPFERWSRWQDTLSDREAAREAARVRQLNHRARRREDEGF